MNDIPADFQPPLPKTDTSSKFYTNIQNMCDDIADTLLDFYSPTKHEEGKSKQPIAYVYMDFGTSNSETIMFGIVCKGVENFNNDKFRTGLEQHLTKKIGLAVSVSRKDWGRVISDLGNPNNNMWLFHIAIPAEYTPLKLGFIE